ncbi:hypothetical protein ACRCQW_33850, partial [Pseudomonas aeruginosa]
GRSVGRPRRATRPSAWGGPWGGRGWPRGPRTTAPGATLFGVRNLSMLGGIVFLFHQLGAFLGGWLGGVVYDRTGSYDLVWQLSILLSLLAALLNWPVRERPVARLQVAGGAA